MFATAPRRWPAHLSCHQIDNSLAADLGEIAYVHLVSEDNGTVTVFFTGDPLTYDQLVAANAIIAAHDPDIIGEKITEFQARTRDLVSTGFEYPPGSGKMFGLELETRVSLISVFLLKDNPYMSYPIRWNSTTPGVSHEIADVADLEAFFFTAFGTGRAITLRPDCGTRSKVQRPRLLLQR